MDRTELLAPFERLLETSCPPATVRAIERGEDASKLWDEIEASGFLDALVPETRGGAGLTLADIAPVLMACGRFAVPLPVGDTIAARFLFSQLGEVAPAGPISLASGHDDGAATGALPAPRAHRFRADGQTLSYHPIDGHGAFREWHEWPDGQAAALAGVPPAEACRLLGALVRAAAIAGAAQWLLDASLAYANDRVQFGKPIGRQQAIQQQLAVMAEHCVAAKMATELACAAGLPLTLPPVATAKAVASSAAPQIAATAHAVHGAIGISAEHDLHLFTQRLHGWRVEHGSEGYWEARLGAERLTMNAGSVDWIRSVIAG